MLRAQGLLPAVASRRRPRSPSPAHGSSSDDDVVEVKDENLKELMVSRDHVFFVSIHIAETSSSTWINIKAQRSALDSRIRAAKKKRVKREHSPIVLGGANGEVIDLTGD